MIKNEQFREYDQLRQATSVGPVASFSLQPSMSQPKPIDVPQRSIDPHAVDISSIKGRFAWEKIALGDTYVPVIFRGTTKYVCVKMLHKLLPEYPEDFIHRSSYYQYRKPIDLYIATPNELELLNRINVQHAHWAYSRQPFTLGSELVRVSDFLPFYEHLRLFLKSSSSIPRSSSIGSMRQILPQTPSVQHSPDFVVHMPNTNRRDSSIALPARPQPVNESLPHNSISSVRRPIVPTPPIHHPIQSSKCSMQPFETARQALQQELSLSTTHQSTVTTSNSIINSTDTVTAAKPWINPPTNSSSHPTLATILALPNGSESLNSGSLSVTSTNKRKSSTGPSEKQSISSLRQSSPIASTSKPVRLYCGWLQINKLYTPFLSVDPSNHHLYKIPVSLLTFYDLLKIPSSDHNTSEFKDSSINMEQTLVTPQEIELLNELCLKQNIKPFSIDTKLISLSTFYRYYSANILFVKELPLNDPKSAICKDWSSIVQINGGICRLRNIKTLEEQTIPFIGKKLIKIFNISSQYLLSASITTPTPLELEFLQLILFFCNMSINLRHAKLIDIESVQKEYTVDLILLYNDKFPSNVLNYQQQGNRPTNSQEQVQQSEASAATNTFAESTPPPSPISPATNHIQSQPVSQLPINSTLPSLISSSSSTSSSPASSSSSNRYQKTVTFHGHTMTAYVCSGLESNVQRECVSVKELCSMLYPDATILDKYETRMLRLLRTKNINRFRPQNQQALAFTRLVDIKDIETHWNYIEQGMTSLSNNDGETNIVRERTLSLPNDGLKTSTTTVDTIVETSHDCMEVQSTIEVDKGEKRSIEREMEREETEKEKEQLCAVEQADKRMRLSGDEQTQQSKSSPKPKLSKNIHHSNDDESQETDSTDTDDRRKKIKIKRSRISTSTIQSVPKSDNVKPTKRLIQQKPTRTINKPIVSSSSNSKVTPMKKKIRISRKRPTSCRRSFEQKVAAWVKKYNIEDCCIRLDLYDPVRDAGRF